MTFVGEATGIRMSELQVGDVNGDGLLDVLALSENGDRHLRVFLGKEDGSFSSGVELGPTGQTAALGDLDGDEELDLALLADASNLRVIYSIGRDHAVEGDVLPVPSASSPGNPHIVLGDWDGDGREDLLIVHGDVRVLFDNKGDRKFGKRWEDPNKYKASHAALGTDHRNINGSKNLYATPQDGANLFVRYPDSEGFSEVVVQHPFPSVEGFDGKGDKLIRAVELNADDHDDLVIGTPVGLFVYRSQDLGGFTSPEWVASRNTKKIFGGTMPGIYDVLIGGISEDVGELEMFSFRNGRIWRRVRFPVGHVTAGAMAQMRGDGTVDVILAEANGRLVAVRGSWRDDRLEWDAVPVFEGASGSILTALGPNSENEIVLVEAKADGRVLAYASDRDPVGDWSFDGVIERLFVADADGNGMDDIFVAIREEDDERLRILLQGRDGEWEEGQTLAVPIPSALRVDVVGGRRLLFLGSTDSLRIFERSAAGTYVAAQEFAGVDLLGIADVTCDGVADLFVSDGTADRVDLLRTDSSGTFQLVEGFAAGAQPVGVAAWTGGKNVISVVGLADGRVSSHFIQPDGKARVLETIRPWGDEVGRLLALERIDIPCPGIGSWVAVREDGGVALGSVDSSGRMAVLEHLPPVAETVAPLSEVRDLDGDGAEDLLIATGSRVVIRKGLCR